MATPTLIRSPYERRLNLISETIQANSKLKDTAADELAVHVLHALNSIPEIMR
jgi:Family of unknown function (DUF6307)